MICVFHTRGAKHGQDQLDTRLWMNGDPGFLMNKLQGTFSPLINISGMFLLVRKKFVQNSTELRISFFFHCFTQFESLLPTGCRYVQGYENNLTFLTVKVCTQKPIYGFHCLSCSF